MEGERSKGKRRREREEEGQRRKGKRKGKRKMPNIRIERGPHTQNTNTNTKMPNIRIELIFSACGGPVLAQHRETQQNN